MYENIKMIRWKREKYKGKIRYYLITLVVSIFYDIIKYTSSNRI